MRRRLAAGFAIAAAVAGCEVIMPGPGPAVTIGTRAFSLEEVERFFASRTPLATGADPALLSALLDEFVDERLLLIGADEAGVEAPAGRLAAEVAALRREPGIEALESEEEAAAGAGRPAPAPTPLEDSVRDRLRVETLVETVILPNLEVSAEALRVEYEANRGLYARPESVSLSELRFEDEEAAEAAAVRLERNASEAGEEAPTDDFTDIGAFRVGDLPAGVEAEVFRLEPGETSGVVRTEAGFRILRVDARAEAEALPFEEVEDVVRLSVLRRDADARMEGFLASLRSRHPVTIHTARLSFPYVGLLADSP